MLSRSPSLEVGPPGVGKAPDSVSVDEADRLNIGRLQYVGVEDLITPQFDNARVQSYGYPGNGRHLFPPYTPLFNKFAVVVLICGLGNLTGPTRSRNIRTGRPAIAYRLHVGKVVRFESRTFIHNLGSHNTHVVFIKACKGWPS